MTLKQRSPPPSHSAIKRRVSHSMNDSQKQGMERREVRRCNDRVPQMSNGTYPLDGWNWVSNVFSSLMKEEENKALPNSSAGSGCSPVAAAVAGKEEAVTYLGSRRLECHTLALPGSDLAAQVARRRPNIAQVTCCIPSLSPPGPSASACPPARRACNPRASQAIFSNFLRADRGLGL